MKEFKVNYDSEEDSLFMYSEGLKPEGSVEIGNFILDLDAKGNLVSMEFLELSFNVWSNLVC